MRLPASARPWLLLLATLAWLWATSVFTPWAADRAPRLWLYDLLFYARVVLVAWGLAECAWWWWRPAQRGHLASLLLGLTLLAGIGGWAYAQTGIGWKWRVLASAPALDALAAQGRSDLRQRAGHVLVDSLRVPCDAATPWFWLGRPHGAGSGINLAIVRSGAMPEAPFADAFRLRRIDGDWWMAYQDGATYRAMQGDGAAAACGTPRQAGSHRDGMAFIAAG